PGALAQDSLPLSAQQDLTGGRARRALGKRLSSPRRKETTRRQTHRLCVPQLYLFAAGHRMGGAQGAVGGLGFIGREVQGAISSLKGTRRDPRSGQSCRLP